MHGPTRGSVVWLDPDQAELDASFDQAGHAANRAQVTGRYAFMAEQCWSRWT
ncbi:MAG: hypothetical protein ACK52M_00755 [bacterium]|jgi:hypothetical protein